MTYVAKAILYFDGASRHNPHGPAGCGFQVVEMDECGAKGDVVVEGCEDLGYDVSNNQAEYYGLIRGLQFIRDNLTIDSLYIRGDSEVVIKQINGEYAVRSPNISPLYEDAMDIIDDLDISRWSAKHVYRHENERCDMLANYAIDVEVTRHWWWP